MLDFKYNYINRFGTNRLQEFNYQDKIKLTIRTISWTLIRLSSLKSAKHNNKSLISISPKTILTINTTSKTLMLAS